MAQSRTLVTAQINFIEDRLSLIQIPLRVYATYVQSILQLLLPVADHDSDSPEPLPSYGSNGSARNGTNGFSPYQSPLPDVPWANMHPFLNISITPIECSIICSRTLAQKYFAPVMSRTPKDGASISSEDYVAVSVEGEGLEAGQRVLELTSPLAMAGIPILFFTTYFSDYILVPSKSRGQVTRALEDRGFAFSPSSHAYINVAAHHRNSSFDSATSVGVNLHPTPSPNTPPPTSIVELQARTFTLLKRRNIFPRVHESIRLVQCAGRNQEDPDLQIGVTRCLVHPPQFFSLTLTESEAPSLLLDQNTLSHFGSCGESTLLGSKDDFLVPITLNLEPLPLEATGIVCGVASKLVGSGPDTGRMVAPVEMSYLSTVRGAAVMVDEHDLNKAVELLKEGEKSSDMEI